MSKSLRLSLCAAALLLSVPAAAHERSDSWITAKTKVALLAAKNLPAANIRVDSFDGNVTLYGTVYDEEQMERAARIANRVEGVGDVVSMLRIVPRPEKPAAKMDDAMLKRDVTQAFREDPAISGEKISVRSVEDGVVTLDGEAKTTLVHLAALEKACRMKGVRDVVSRVREESRPADAVAWNLYAPTTNMKQRTSADRLLYDTRITAQVRERMIADPVVPALDVKLDTRRGVVTLFGVVSDASAKQHAESLATGVPGVSRVENDIQVVSAEARAMEPRTDAEIRAAVERVLMKRGYADAKVSVTDGMVTLSGPIEMSTDQLRAAMFARSVEGVKAVSQDFQPMMKRRKGGK